MRRYPVALGTRLATRGCRLASIALLGADVRFPVQRAALAEGGGADATGDCFWVVLGLGEEGLTGWPTVV
jgi:hypothetical protein